MAKVLIKRPTDIIERTVRLQGMAHVMFDRYAGDNKTKLQPGQMFYLDPTDSATIGLPNTNIMSLLSAHNTNSAPKRLRDARQFKKIANACLSYVSIEPAFIPFLRNDKPIKFTGFDSKNEVCPTSNAYIHRAVARLDKGIPNPKTRPVLPTPWELEFKITIFPNQEIQEQEIVNLLSEAGLAIGIGTFRGVFGKYIVTRWD